MRSYILQEMHFVAGRTISPTIDDKSLADNATTESLNVHNCSNCLGYKIFELSKTIYIRKKICVNG